MTHMRKKLDKLELTPYEYIQGEAASKPIHSQIKFFNWNTCLLPGKLSGLFAGLSSWPERIAQVSTLIKEQDADLVCLQEVHSEPAAFQLYQALKSEYAHFYMNMGPMIMGAQMSDVGLNSGLFIASKFPLEDIHFETFKSDEGQKLINKGFFWAKLASSEVGFTTCHLEPMNSDVSQKIRYQELNHLIQFMQSKKTQVRVLSGDLNIPWGSQEGAEKLIKNHFYDPYNKNRQDVTSYSRTYSDVFLNHKKTGSCEILDYFLILQVPGFEKYAFLTERVEGFDELSLKSKGSDHHGLFSEIVFPYQK